MNFINGAVTANGLMIFTQEGSPFAFQIPEEHKRKLTSIASGRVTLGIRPEHIYSQAPAGVDTVAPFTVQVEVVEPVGNEVFVYFTTGTDAQYVARFATDHPPRVGKPCTLLLDTSKIHFFDKDSGRAL
jgi:multiple sugar transport system ATP-binding protein